MADTTTFNALLSSNNASDYMARSTTWANTIVANQSYMNSIGAKDYCSDALLSNNTWRDAICNSTYFESILNVKIPAMTSNTTPSGEAFASSIYSASYDAWKAFTGTNSGYWCSKYGEGVGAYLGYTFTQQVKIYKITAHRLASDETIYNFKIQYKDSQEQWVDNPNSEFTYPGTNTPKYFNFYSGTASNSWRIYFINNNNGKAAATRGQFYGRAVIA